MSLIQKFLIFIKKSVIKIIGVVLTEMNVWLFILIDVIFVQSYMWHVLLAWTIPLYEENY